jgi:hypothetical protein
MSTNQIEARIQVATHQDVDEISRVLIDSIKNLCFADHRGENVLLDAWLSNKTPDNIGKWLAMPDVGMFVAVSHERVSGVCAVHWKGHVVLNYVNPSFRLLGISSAMLRHMEEALLLKGVSSASLVSTLTAKEFYVSRGWSLSGDPRETNGMIGYPMTKNLVPNHGAHSTARMKSSDL